MQELFGSAGELCLDRLRHVRADTLVVSGEWGVIRPEHTRQIASLLPRAQLELFPLNDHDPEVP